MTAVLALAASAYRQANLDQTLTTFNSSLEFPYNIALDLVNTVIQEMNRMGSYWWCKHDKTLIWNTDTYNTTSNQISMNNVLETTGFSDPNKVLRIRRNLIGYEGELTQVNYRSFTRMFPPSSLTSGMPTYWTKVNVGASLAGASNTFQGVYILLNTKPDQDYMITVTYYQDIPLVVNDNDSLPIPTSDEDVIREGILAYLKQRMGAPDYQVYYQSYTAKLSSLLADQKQDSGMARQLPAAF